MLSKLNLISTEKRLFYGDGNDQKALLPPNKHQGGHQEDFCELSAETSLSAVFFHTHSFAVPVDLANAAFRQDRGADILPVGY